MAKDSDIEWRLVATKGRESCRWQAAEGSTWIALTLGAQGDITKVVVSASDGRAEIVDGYEQGLNVARRWRNDWKMSDPPQSAASGSWLPPLPGRSAEASSDDSSSPGVESVGRPGSTGHSDASRSGASLPNRSRASGPGETHGFTARPSDSPHSRASQGVNPAKSSPVSASSDDRTGIDGRSWPPKGAAAPGSSRSVNRHVSDVFGDHSGLPGSGPAEPKNPSIPPKKS